MSEKKAAWFRVPASAAGAEVKAPGLWTEQENKPLQSNGLCSTWNASVRVGGTPYPARSVGREGEQ